LFAYPYMMLVLLSTQQAETPSFPPLTATGRFPQNTVQWAHRMLTQQCWRRPASAVGYAVVRVLPMTCRNSASLRVRQSSGRVALNLVVWTLRSRTAESYANAGVRPVAITTPEFPSSTSGIAMAVDTCCRYDFLLCSFQACHCVAQSLRRC
jgi:hypothetical protein